MLEFKISVTVTDTDQNTADIQGHARDVGDLLLFNRLTHQAAKQKFHITGWNLLAA